MPRKKNINDLAGGGNVGYCRKCMSVLPIIKFYSTTNSLLDTNGKMSICRECCADIYDTYFSINGSVERAIMLTCEDLDIKFSELAVTQTISHIETNISAKKKADKPFGIYKSKLMLTGSDSDSQTLSRYRNSQIYIDAFAPRDGMESRYGEIDVAKPDPELLLFWGDTFNLSEITYLEYELGRWKETHKCDNNAELVLIKEICIKQLEIRKGRDDGNVSLKNIDMLQVLMKTASLDPAKSNIASAGKLHESWGCYIRDVEEHTPAEWHEDQSKYRDMDGLLTYLLDYITRPIRNFFTGDRNFLISDNNVGISYDDDSDGGE
jgi:hypothetical protein